MLERCIQTFWKMYLKRFFIMEQEECSRQLQSSIRCQSRPSFSKQQEPSVQQFVEFWFFSGKGDCRRVFSLSYWSPSVSLFCLYLPGSHPPSAWLSPAGGSFIPSVTKLIMYVELLSSCLHREALCVDPRALSVYDF